MNKFDVFTYQISAVTTVQTNLFSENITLEELIDKKNDIFSDIFTEDITFYSKRHKLNHKIEYIDEDFILLRLANKKTVKIEKNFQQEYFESEPSCLICIYNNPKIQLIAIESDKSSFGNSFSVLKILEKTIDRELSESNLQFYPQPKYEPKLLWDLLDKYRNRIEKLKFEFSKPNLARVNATLSEELKNTSKALNSATTKIEFEAPRKNVLENLNPDNEELVDLINASSEGSGPAKFKLSGIRSWESTEEKVKSFEIDTIEINADDKTIAKFVSALKSILKRE
ncbi:hypothetical protein [Empedobacter brevis]|uniref:hypothetical protein n=1 Tax=Empedobacter brevis TaxID=247 RepID=UPI0028A1F999|nr:hypothetical protein [Empedobacter brevis]